MAALALLVVGGMALVNAVTGSPDAQGPVTAASPDGGGTDASPGESAAPSPSSTPPLVIRVTGEPTRVVVRVADTSGKVLTNSVLNTGETLQYQEVPLQVVASDGAAVQVSIHGEVQPRKPAGQRAQWFVSARE